MNSKLKGMFQSKKFQDLNEKLLCGESKSCINYKLLISFLADQHRSEKEKMHPKYNENIITEFFIFLLKLPYFHYFS